MIGDQLAVIVASVDSHVRAGIASHGAITDRAARLEGKLDQALRSKRERPSRQIVTPHGRPMIRDPDPELTG